MSKLPLMPLYVDAYLADTTHLSAEEHGVYLLLLMAMWRRNGWVPDEDKDLARICCVTRRKWVHIKQRLRPMLIFEQGEITQKKLNKLCGSSHLFSTQSVQKSHEINGTGSSKNNDLDLFSRARVQTIPLKEIYKEKGNGDLAPRRRTNDWDLPPSPGPPKPTAFLAKWKTKGH